jgi:hypothetical protein
VNKGDDAPEDDRDGNRGADPKANAEPVPVSLPSRRIPSGFSDPNPRLEILLLQLETYYRDKKLSEMQQT